MSQWMPAGLGAEPKKVAFLIFLVVLAPVAYYYGNSSDAPAAAPSRPRTPLPVVDPAPVVRPNPRPVTRAAARTEDFRPTLKLPEDFDLTKVDPTLKTQLLAKVREVGDVGGTRSLFEFYTPPPQPPPKVDPIKPTGPQPETVAEVKPAGPVKPPPPPPPPPIPLKYFGYEGTPRGGRLRAMFVEGDQHYVVGQNDIIKNRYRIVRIGTTSAEVEDTVAKNTQTLSIAGRCEDVPDGRCEAR